jgi:hypothetical protein
MISGANLDTLHSASRTLAAIAQRFGASATTITSAVQRTTWQGQDADAFRQAFNGCGLAQLRAAQELIDGLSKSLVGQAEEQNRTSSADATVAIGSLQLLAGSVSGTAPAVGTAIGGSDNVGYRGVDGTAPVNRFGSGALLFAATGKRSGTVNTVNQARPESQASKSGGNESGVNESDGESESGADFSVEFSAGSATMASGCFANGGGYKDEISISTSGTRGGGRVSATFSMENGKLVMSGVELAGGFIGSVALGSFSVSATGYKAYGPSFSRPIKNPDGSTTTVKHEPLLGKSVSESTPGCLTNTVGQRTTVTRTAADGKTSSSVMIEFTHSEWHCPTNECAPEPTSQLTTAPSTTAPPRTKGPILTPLPGTQPRPKPDLQPKPQLPEKPLFPTKPRVPLTNPKLTPDRPLNPSLDTPPILPPISLL